ncbi:hypothetical protein AVEN_26741-1 [Araneus ventricosus]|uniref:Uncharacterized protein n=1 Tax=Araneus ventricosus TaxID=182803 RepID=A0A4Y2H7L3_ARAVE|nr:hypothetical protein AVEN_26741-1 [Araneus ventricosus]
MENVLCTCKSVKTKLTASLSMGTIEGSIKNMNTTAFHIRYFLLVLWCRPIGSPYTVLSTKAVENFEVVPTEEEYLAEELLHLDTTMPELCNVYDLQKLLQPLPQIERDDKKILE